MERQDPGTHTIMSYDVLGEMNAGNLFARRSLEAIEYCCKQPWM